MLDLEPIKAREAAATAGPWETIHKHSQCTVKDDEMDGLGLRIDGPPEAWNRGQFEKGADAVFIAASRADIPALIAEVERVRAEGERR